MLDDQTRLSRLATALQNDKNVAELSMDELTHELETHGIQAKQIYSGVAAIFEKAGLAPPASLKSEPAWLSRAREKKRWFQEKLKQVKESAQETLGTLGAEPSPVFFRNQKSPTAGDDESVGTQQDQKTLAQDQALLDLIANSDSRK